MQERFAAQRTTPYQTNKVLLGHVAFQLSELVGSAGAVVGIDQAAAMLAVAEQRRVNGGIENVTFVEADVRTFRDPEAFDAVVGRLILFHLPDALETLRHHVGGLADEGLMVMIDFDVGSARSEPPVPLFNTARDWAMRRQTRRCQSDDWHPAWAAVARRRPDRYRDLRNPELPASGQSSRASSSRERCHQPRPGDPCERNRDRGGTGPRLTPGTAHS